MHSAAAVAEYLSQVLIALTAISAVNAALRRQDPHRLNILAFVGALEGSYLFSHPAHPMLSAIGTALFFALPYFLLRLARHFRNIPPVVLNASLVPAALSLLVIVRPDFLRARVPYVPMCWYASGFCVYTALMFLTEVRRTAGVTQHRLTFAAAGTVLFSFVFAGASVRSRSTILVQPVQISHALGLACYFLTFTTPRFLRNTWQRAEQAQFLSATANRDPEERGWRAAPDLVEAARRSVGHSLVLVALRPSPADDTLVVRASTDQTWLGTAIDASAGVVGRVAATRVAELARPVDCASDLAERIAALGNRVLVVPIAASADLWGVAIVPQRRGSLFPEDDLALLANLGRYTATALDHAALVTDARDRERRRADVRLQAAEARMALMLESIKDYAMFVVDRDGLVVTWPVGATHVFGHTADAMTGEPAAPLYNLPSRAFRARLDEARELGRAVWEGPCRRQNGERFTGATVLRPLAGTSDVAGFVAVTRDVTEQRHLEDRLRQSQKMEAIGQLAGGIAHDFNNLLHAVMGNAELLAENEEDPERMGFLAQIERSVERAEALTRRLLAFGRQQLLQPTVVSLSTLVTELLPMLRPVIAEHIEIVTETSNDARPVLGDRSQLEQVIVNLAVNARDAMPHGGQLRISTRTAWLDEAAAGGEVPAGAYALLEVADTGIGMDAATRERIFEPFFTTKSFGYGTGLGLATVYGIVKQMGGLIRVASEPGHGATFQVYLPETQQRVQPAAAPAPSPPPRGDETLLLVEDDGAVRTFLVRALERHGYRVLAADHPSVALGIAQSYADPIDLLITDVVLPGLVGPEFVRALAELRGDRPPLPVLYISGYADGSPVWRGEVPKASHFLQKPFTAAELLTRIRQILPPGRPPGSPAGHAV